MSSKLFIYWSRRDLRLRDNRALTLAINDSATQHVPLLPVFLIEPYMTAGDPTFQFGAPSRWFLAQAIPSFAERFPTFYLGHAKPVAFFTKLAQRYDLTIYANEDVYPDFYTQLRKLEKAGITIKLVRDRLTIPKDTRTQSGHIYSVFTPFKNAVWNTFIDTPEDPTPRLTRATFADPTTMHIAATRIDHTRRSVIASLFARTEAIRINSTTINLETLNLPARNLDAWHVTEQDALRQCDRYLDVHVAAYDTRRDALGIDGTSRLSVALAWGLISARTIVQRLKPYLASHGAQTYVSELIWREFYAYLLFHHPQLMTTAFQEKRRHIAWEESRIAKTRFVAWMQGQTGYPIVDAAMRQLASTGWMHNRCRMIVSSVLTKNLGVDWRWGQEYFRAMLLDLDEASNNGGWQWGASVGADPKPIRIFNPSLQAKTYDPKNAYQRTWLPATYLAHPPAPILEHTEARKQAIARYVKNT